MMIKQSPSAGLGGFLVVLAGVLWGSIGLFNTHLTAAGLSSMQISELRSGITGLLMLLVTLCVSPKLLRVRLRDLWCFVGTGVCSVLLFNYCYFQTIRESGMTVAATLLYTSPVFVMLLSVWLFREKFTSRKGASLLLTVSGVVLVSGVLSDDTAVLSPAGIGLGVGAGFAYALYSIFSRFAIQRGYQPLTITTYTFLFAGAGGVFFTDFGEIRVAFATGGWGLWLLVLAYVLVAALAPYLLYTIGLQRVENSKAAVMAAVEPVSAALLDILVLHKMPGGMTTAGLLLVIVAIVVLNTEKKRKRIAPSFKEEQNSPR